MNEKCDHCPLLTEDKPCPGQRNDRVCKRADPKSELHDPGILRKIVNFTVAVVQHVAAGMPETSAEVQAERLAICRSNECGFYREADRCRHGGCGCYLVAKIRWADQGCPLDPPRWKSIEAQKEGATGVAPTEETATVAG